MQQYNRRIEKLLNKVYLSRLSISNYSNYYGNLLKNLDFKITTEEFHKVIDGDSFYLNDKMVENENPTKIALFIVSEFEKHMIELGVYTNSLRAVTADLDFNGDTAVSSNNTDGKREKKKFWKDKMQETVAILGGEKSLGEIPLNARIFINREKKEKINWKDELRDYIVKDISDYSFSPPDKRYTDIDFYLPAFNDETEKLENILFMIDISGSMKDEVISDVFNEVKNVKDQFRGKVDGYVGWFDTCVRDVKRIDEIQKVESLQRKNIDGTSFIDIFSYIKEKLGHIDFKALIILTDGYGQYPRVDMVGDMQVTWVLTQPDCKVPFGNIIRYEYKKGK